MESHSSTTRAPVTAAHRAALRAWIDEAGEASVLSRIGLSRMGLYRVLSGLSVLTGTRALLAERLRAHGRIRSD